MDTEALTAEIRGIGAHGEGVGRLPDGRTVFVHRTCPGDSLTLQVVKEADRWVRGRLVDIVTASSARRPAPCPYYADCGGCSLQHMAYEEQVRWKRARVEESLVRIAGIHMPVDVMVPSPSEYRYRSRVTLHVRRLPGQRVVAGFHRLGRPGRIVDTDGACLLMDPLLSETWDGIRAAWGPGARMMPAGRALDITLQRVGGDVTMVVRGGRGTGDAQVLVDAVGPLASIWAVDREARLLAGDETSVWEWAGDRQLLGPTAFLQANTAANDLLWGLLSGELGDVRGLRLVDAYAGVGAFARRWARDGAAVTAIELNGDAVDAARSEAPEGLEVRKGTVEVELPMALPADAVVLNPPRVGVASDVIDALLTHRPPLLLYVSCDPATLARDIRRLAPGYDLVRLQAVDLFPQTGHVEVLASLRAR